MRKKRLGAKEIAQLTQMILAGKSNGEIAEHFEVSNATVNNHRTRLKREGVEVPKGKRGRKPKPDGVKVPKAPGRRGRPKGSSSGSAAASSGQAQKVKTSVKMESYVFNVNGVSVTVSGKSKAVHIGAKGMTIEF